LEDEFGDVEFDDDFGLEDEADLDMGAKKKE